MESDLDDPTPIVKELNVTWDKVKIEEYDAAAQYMTARWQDGAAVGIINGENSPASRWVWRASIDEVTNGHYVLAGQLRGENIEASFYWSRVIDSIVGALMNKTDKDVTRGVPLNSAAELSAKMPKALRVELKDANGGLNIPETIEVDSSIWKIVEGRVCDSTETYHWRHLTPEDSTVTGEAGSGAKAGVLAVQPSLTGYTFTESADPAMAEVWYQWGKIITALTKADGTPFDAIAAAKTPILTINITGNASLMPEILWDSLTSKAQYLKRQFKVELLDKTSNTGNGFKTEQMYADWGEKPAMHDETFMAGMSQPAANFENPALGQVFDEDLVREFNGREPYADISWKLTPVSGNIDNGKMVATLPGGRPMIQGAGGVKVSYSNNPWDMVASVATSASAANNPGSCQQSISFPGYDIPTTFNGVAYSLSCQPAGGGYYVKYDITATNVSGADRWAGFAWGADVMIGGDDSANVVKTSQGFIMQERTGSHHQFNILIKDNVSGISTSADCQFACRYSNRSQHYWEEGFADGTVYTDSAGQQYIGGFDTGLTFCWLPSKHKLAPNESVTFTCMFGVGYVSEPPLINPIRTSVTPNGSKLDVTAYMAGQSDTKLQLYYRFDEGLPSETTEISVGTMQQGKGAATQTQLHNFTSAQKDNYYRTSSDFFGVTTSISKPRNWVAGEYHSITLFVLNDAGSMSEGIVIPLFVEENEDGDEVLTGATEATLSFSRGEGGGTAPASVQAHLQEPVTLPRQGKMTAPSGKKFVGWNYTHSVDGVTQTTTYPADSYFYVERDGITLTARWIPTSETMYMVETYLQTPSGDYDQLGTIVETVGGTGDITYTPAGRTGYEVNTQKSTLSVARADGAKIKVYYDILKYDVVFNTNGAPGGDATGVFSTTESAYGTNVSGVPNAAALNAGQNNKYFSFVGWYDQPDTVTDPASVNVIDTSTVVDEDTLTPPEGSTDPAAKGAKLYAYAKWRPLNNAQITFDYAYRNHAQGAVRSDKIALTPIFDVARTAVAGSYGYRAKPARMPSNPSAWKDTNGNVYTFVEWRRDVNDPATVVTADTDTLPYENLTVTAVWRESYTVSRSFRGQGRVYDVNDVGTVPKSYAAGDTADIRWQAAPGYFVEHVTVDGVNRDDLISLGYWRQEIINENHSVYVVFSEGEGNSGISEETLYDITATPVGGTYRAHFGEDYTVKWRVSPGYTLTEYTINGIPYEIDDGIRNSNSFTFNDIHTSQEIVVKAERTDSAGGGAQLNRGPYPITTKIAKGTSITPGATVNWKSDYEVSWRVPYGFVVNTVIVNNLILSNIPQNNSYTFRNVSMPSSIVVMCGPDPDLPEEAVYVATTIDHGGTITPSTPVGQLSKGDNHTVTWSTDATHYVKAVYIDDVLQQTESGANKIYYSHTFTNIQAPHDVMVELGEVTEQTYAISTEIVNGGSIEKPGSVPAGSDVVVNWTLAANHRVKDVYLDGAKVSDYNAETDGNSYTIRDVQAAHTLKVECERIDSHVDMTDKWIVTTNINLGASDGQKIVANGDPCTVNWTPPTGYHVTSLKVDGVEQAYVTGNGWTIPSVTKNMTVDVTVAKDDDASTYTVEAAIVNGGTVSGGGTFAVGMGTMMSWTVAEGFRVTDVNIDGVTVAGLDLENTTSYAFPADMGQAGQTYHFNVVCAPRQYYHVRPSGTGVVELTEGKDVFLGDACTVSWKAAPQYRFVEARVNGEVITPALSGDTYSYTFDSSNTAANATYNVVVTCEKIPSYTIVTGGTSGGTVSASKTLNQGDEPYMVIWTANSGYRVKAVMVDEGEGEEAFAGTQYVFSYADGRNVNLRVEFEPIKHYTVKGVGQNTTVTPSTQTHTVDEDATLSWTKPDGFELSALTVNGEAVSFTANQTSYTFDHTTVVADQTYEVVVTYAPEGTVPVPPEQLYHITTSGSFTTDLTDDFDVKVGEDGEVTWQILTGYRLREVTVDGNAAAYDEEDGVYSVTISGEGRADGDVVPVVVTCEKIPSGQPGGGGEVITPYSVYAYANDASLGTVSPASSTLRAEGTTATVTWSANRYAHVASVKVSDAPDRSNQITLDAAAVASGVYTFNYDDHQDKIVDVEFEADPEYTVTAEAAGTTGAGCGVTVSGVNPLKETGESAYVTWTVGTGYHVASIAVSDYPNAENVRPLTAEEIAAGSYTFAYDAHEDQMVYVVFEQDPVYEISIVGVNGGADSRVTGGATLTTAGQTHMVTWAAGTGYRIRNIAITNTDGTNAENLTAAQTAAGSYTFSYDTMTADRVVTVTFEKETSGTDPVYAVTTSVSDAAMGTISPSAVLSARGATYAVTWNANPGYRVKSVTVNGEAYAQESYTFRYNDHADATVHVEFEALEAYQITTQKVGGGAGSVVREGTTLSTSGATYAVTWSADSGFKVDSVVITDNYGQTLKTLTEEEIAAGKHTFAYDDMVGDEILTVTFVVDTSSGSGTGTTPYAVTTQVLPAEGGSIDPSKTLRRDGEEYEVTWSANPGYRVKSVTVDDGEATAYAGASYTFRYDEHKDVLVTVEFELIPQYTVLAEKQGNGGADSIVSDGATLAPGQTHTVTWLAGEGYNVRSVVISKPDGTDRKQLSNSDMALGAYTFTYDGMGGSDRRIVVTFEKDEGTIPGGGDLPATPYTVQTSVNDATMGSVSPSKTLREADSEYLVTWSANPGYFRNVKTTQTVEYVFTSETGENEYTPYQLSVELVDGRGERDVLRWVAAGATDSIGWTLEPGYYVDHVAILRNNTETEIDQLDDAVLGHDSEKDKDFVTLSNVQADNVVKVYLKRGTQPDPKDAADFSLSIDVLGPGAADPSIRVYGAGMGMTAGEHTASWDVGDRTITMIKVDGEILDEAEFAAAIANSSVTINMTKEGENPILDHSVVIYLEGVVAPSLEKSAGTQTGATVGDRIPYVITVRNETDQAIWKGVTLTDAIPDGLTVDVSTLGFYHIDADGTEKPVSGASYDAATRTVRTTPVDIRKEDKFELRFEATVDMDAAGKDIGNQVTAAGRNSGTDELVEETTGKVYPGGKQAVLPKDPAPHITKKAENVDASSTHTRVGDVVRYTIDVWNSEPGSVWKSVKLQDNLPNGLEMVAGSLELYEVVGLTQKEAPNTVSVAYDSANRRISADLGDIGHEVHYRICFNVNVLKGAMDSDIGNIALAAGQKPDKTPESVETPPVYPAEADKGGVLPASPKPEIVKDVENLDRTGEQSRVGDKLRYSVTIRNHQEESIWKNAVVRDRIPEGMELDTSSITLEGGFGRMTLSNVYTAADRMLSVYLGDINDGDVYVLTYTVTLTTDVLETDIGNIAWAKGKDPALEGGNDPIPNAPVDIRTGDWYNPGGSNWPDEGAITSDKVYPDISDRPVPGGAKLTKTAKNLSQPGFKRGNPDDVIEYEIEIANTQAGSLLRDVVVRDEIPEMLDMAKSVITLIRPDGTTQKLSLADVYDAKTRVMTVTLPDSVRAGGTYWLRYTATVVKNGHEQQQIVNRASATGRDAAGNVIRVSDEHVLVYEDDDVPRTGDESHTMRYVMLMLVSGFVLIACGLDERRRRKACKG